MMVLLGVALVNFQVNSFLAWCFMFTTFTFSNHFCSLSPSFFFSFQPIQFLALLVSLWRKMWLLAAWHLFLLVKGHWRSFLFVVWFFPQTWYFLLILLIGHYFSSLMVCGPIIRAHWLCWWFNYLWIVRFNCMGQLWIWRLAASYEPSLLIMSK